MGDSFVWYKSVVKKCIRCGEDQPLDQFYRSKHPGYLDGRKAACKTCEAKRFKIAHEANPLLRRNRVLRHRYGIDHSDYLRMLEEQGGGCAICGSTESKRKSRDGYLCIDHDHETGKVRGILCHECNLAIGYLQSPAFTQQVMAYLAKYEAVV